MEELSDWRREIDEINFNILKELSKRKEIVKKIGEFKKNNNIEVLDSKREQEINNKLRAKAIEIGLNEDFIIDIFKMIISESKREQEIKCRMK